MVDQCAPFLLGEQLVGLAGEGRGLRDRLHPMIYNPLGYPEQAGQIGPHLCIAGRGGPPPFLTPCEAQVAP